MLFSYLISSYFLVLYVGWYAARQGVPSARLVGKSQASSNDGGGGVEDESLSKLQHRLIIVADFSTRRFVASQLAIQGLR